MNTKFSIEEKKILALLLEHPYADSFWIGEYVGDAAKTTNLLSALRQEGYARQWTFQREQTHLRSLWAASPEGVQALAEEYGLKSKSLRKEHAYSRGRMTHLFLNLERVTRVRFFLKLLESYNPPDVGPRRHFAIGVTPYVFSPGWEWQILAWQEEVKVAGRQGKRQLPASFHGAVLFQHYETQRLLPVLIEYDDPNLPVRAQQERLKRWLMSQHEANAFDADGNLQLPALVIVASNEYRSSEYINLLRGLALRNHLSLPGIYVTTKERLEEAKGNPACHIWFNLNVGAERMLLEDEHGWMGLPGEKTWTRVVARVHPHKEVFVEPDSKNAGAVRLDDLAAMNLSIPPSEYRLLRVMAAHPLLSTQEVSQFLGISWAKCRESAKKLTERNLVERKAVLHPRTGLEAASVEADPRAAARKLETGYYVVTDRAERLLAATDGFGSALQRYRREKLWSPAQTRRLVREWAHTRLTNMLFVKLAQAVRQRDLEMEWLSETESRLYFWINGERKTFLPDGHGLLRIGAHVRHFVVEIDSGRMNAGRIRGKLANYYAAVCERILSENPDEVLRIFLVTHSVARMRSLIRIANEEYAAIEQDSAHSLRRTAPVLFGQSQMLLHPDLFIDRAIWTNLDGEREYCFPEFAKEPPVTIARPPIVTYKS